MTWFDRILDTLTLRHRMCLCGMFLIIWRLNTGPLPPSWDTTLKIAS